MSEKKLGPSDFKAEVDWLRATGKLPSLEEVLDAVADARRKFAAKSWKLVSKAGLAALDSDTQLNDV